MRNTSDSRLLQIVRPSQILLAAGKDAQGRRRSAGNREFDAGFRGDYGRVGGLAQARLEGAAILGQHWKRLIVAGDYELRANHPGSPGGM